MWCRYVCLFNYEQREINDAISAAAVGVFFNSSTVLQRKIAHTHTCVLVTMATTKQSVVATSPENERKKKRHARHHRTTERWWTPELGWPSPCRCELAEAQIVLFTSVMNYLFKQRNDQRKSSVLRIRNAVTTLVISLLTVGNFFSFPSFEMRSLEFCGVRFFFFLLPRTKIYRFLVNHFLRARNVHYTKATTAKTKTTTIRMHFVPVFIIHKS